jgi:hypothetical protein
MMTEADAGAAFDRCRARFPAGVSAASGILDSVARLNAAWGRLGFSVSNILDDVHGVRYFVFGNQVWASSVQCVRAVWRCGGEAVGVCVFRAVASSFETCGGCGVCGVGGACSVVTCRSGSQRSWTSSWGTRGESPPPPAVVLVAFAARGDCRPVLCASPERVLVVRCVIRWGVLSNA